MSMNVYYKAQIRLNLIIFSFMLAGIILMLMSPSEAGALQAEGLENLKFYTVLSNIFCGIVALIYVFMILAGKDTSKLDVFKLAAVCGVAITFSVVAFFFGPLYGYLRFYKNANLVFHLLEPLMAMAEFIIIRRKKMPFKYTVIAAVPTLIYGACYMLNILINGIGGAWPDTNDFYAFLSWGWPVGILIFSGITLAAFAAACLFRFISNKRAV